MFPALIQPGVSWCCLLSEPCVDVSFFNLFCSISSLGFWDVLSFEWSWLLPYVLHQEVHGLECLCLVESSLLSRLHPYRTRHFIVGFHLWYIEPVLFQSYHRPKDRGPTWALVPWWPLLGTQWQSTSAMGVLPGWLVCSYWWCLTPQLEDFQHLLLHKLGTCCPGQAVSFAVNCFIYN